MQSDIGAGAYPKNLNRQIHGLRGVSALAVFIYHVYGMGTLWNFWPVELAPADGFFAAGKHGVEIFFIISGYLITGSLVRHGDAGRFLVDRAIRLYPVFMTIQLLVFTLGPFMHYRLFDGISATAWIMNFVANGLFLPGVFDLPLVQLNAWSLSYEAAFYLLAATIFVAARRWGRWAASAALLLALALLIPIHPRAVFFLPGVIVFFVARRLVITLPVWFRILSLPAFAATLALLTIAETRPGLIYLATAPALVFFICVVEGRCLFSTLLRTRFPQFLGTISYSFYLWSPVVTYPLKLAIQKILHGRINDLLIVTLFATIGFVASLLVAYLSYRVLEDWTGRRLHRWAGARRIRTASPRPA